MKKLFFPFWLLFLFNLSGFSQNAAGSLGKETFRFRDQTLPPEERVDDLVSRMTLDEKVLQMQNDAPAISRLGVPAYNWWNECLHGVARNGIATVFPQAIGMAATWDPDLIGEEAGIISTEARAKYNEARRTGKNEIYQGLTFWSPNINIFRDPRWGRGQETYGEDPYLTGRIGVAFVKGLQGDDPYYFKVISTAKHFAVHSGPESTRHKFDAWCSDQDVYETYLPAFEALIREGRAGSVMGAYNRFRNVPCCASDLFLDQTLREKWGFRGYVVSDCGAVWDMFNGHNLVNDAEKASVMSVEAGCDLTCGNEYGSLVKAVGDGYISKSAIDRSVKRLFMARFRLGMFDPDSLVPFSGKSMADNDRQESRELARKVARESIVLLKNENNLLPLPGKIRSIAVIGPYADQVNVLLGNYNGTPSSPVTILQGIKEGAGKNVSVRYAEGVVPMEMYARDKASADHNEEKLEKEAIELAYSCDIVIFVGGISPELEGEELRVAIDGFSGGDRTHMNLPANQAKLLEKIHSSGKKIILVLTNGSALSIGWAKDHLPAIIEAWYPGEEGGHAVADVIFGNYNPAGRLPVTFYSSVNDLPPFEDYSMKGRDLPLFYRKTALPFWFWTKFHLL